MSPELEALRWGGHGTGDPPRSPPHTLTPTGAEFPLGFPRGRWLLDKCTAPGGLRRHTGPFPVLSHTGEAAEPWGPVALWGPSAHELALSRGPPEPALLPLPASVKTMRSGSGVRPRGVGCVLRSPLGVLGLVGGGRGGLRTAERQLASGEGAADGCRVLLASPGRPPPTREAQAELALQGWTRGLCGVIPISLPQHWSHSESQRCWDHHSLRVSGLPAWPGSSPRPAPGRLGPRSSLLVQPDYKPGTGETTGQRVLGRVGEWGVEKAPPALASRLVLPQWPQWSRESGTNGRNLQGSAEPLCAPPSAP